MPMNKQRKSDTQRGIEWTDYTWNPVGGCLHDCRWEMPDGSIAQCYAKTVAEKFTRAYQHGFEHHYWNEERLTDPLRLKEPSRIFLDSMSDLMGHWVEKHEIEAVLDICRRAHWHTFQLLTKNAPRLRQFNFPPNVWVGASVPPSFYKGLRLTPHQQKRMLSGTLHVLAEIDVPVRWMSIEPLSWDIAEDMGLHGLKWIVIGAASNGAKVYQPEPKWVTNLLTLMDDTATPVFMKGNLRGNAGVAEWREDFPGIVTREVVNLQLSMFASGA